MLKEGKLLKELPSTLVFNKKGVQNFPNNQKVALYYCESLKKYFSISYNKSGLELSESDYSFMDELKSIDDIKEISFNNGLSLNINKECADHIISLYNSLLNEDKEEFVEFIEQDGDNFLHVLEYSVKNKEKIDG
jgi:hypothetical protein